MRYLPYSLLIRGQIVLFSGYAFYYLTKIWLLCTRLKKHWVQSLFEFSYK